MWLSCKEKGLDVEVLADDTKIARVVRHGWKSFLFTAEELRKYHAYSDKVV